MYGNRELQIKVGEEENYPSFRNISPSREAKKNGAETGINPLSSNSDQHKISPHLISVLQHIQVMRIKQTNTKDKLSWT